MALNAGRLNDQDINPFIYQYDSGYSELSECRDHLRLYQASLGRFGNIQA
jgi:hypothetical protein